MDLENKEMTINDAINFINDGFLKPESSEKLLLYDLKTDLYALPSDDVLMLKKALCVLVDRYDDMVPINKYNEVVRERDEAVAELKDINECLHNQMSGAMKELIETMRSKKQVELEHELMKWYKLNKISSLVVADILEKADRYRPHEFCEAYDYAVDVLKSEPVPMPVIDDIKRKMVHFEDFPKIASIIDDMIKPYRIDKKDGEKRMNTVIDNCGNIYEKVEVGTDGQLYVLDMSTSFITYEKETYTKEEVLNIFKELLNQIDNVEDPEYIINTHELPLDTDGTTLPLETYAIQCYSRGWEDSRDVIEEMMNKLKGGYKNE